MRAMVRHALLAVALLVAVSLMATKKTAVGTEVEILEVEEKQDEKVTEVGVVVEPEENDDEKAAEVDVVVKRKAKDDEKMADLEAIFSKPALDLADNSTSADLQNWYSMWRDVLHLRIDGLESAIELRRAAATAKRAAENAGEDGVDASREPDFDSDRGFKIAMVGDSTLRMQAWALGYLLRARTTSDGEPQCFSASNTTNTGIVDLRCKGSDGHISFSVDFTKVFAGCVINDVDADFVYFGCGLHLLHLYPERALERTPVDRWVHYERVLEEAVLAYRAGNSTIGRKGSIGEAFMTTHSFAEEKLDGAYHTRLQEYAEKNETVLANCREKVGRLEILHPDWENEYPPETICTNGLFGEVSVVELNRRAETVMTRLGVPLVPGYDITQGQTWATPEEDGRHYPALVPVELGSLLAEITHALRTQ